MGGYPTRLGDNAGSGVGGAVDTAGQINWVCKKKKQGNLKIWVQLIIFRSGGQGGGEGSERRSFRITDFHSQYVTQKLDHSVS